MNKGEKAKIKKENDALENYLRYGIDLYKRRIYFGDVAFPDGDEFDFSTISYALRAIDKMLDINETEPIELVVSSYGGDPYAMLALMDKIQQAPCKFIFRGSGFIMSAATWIMAVCDERYLAENTVIMVHDGWWGNTASSTDMTILQDEDKRLKDMLCKVFADNSFMSPEFWAKVCQRDLYLTAEETIQLGLADKITSPRKRGNFRKGVRRKTFSKPPSESKIKKLVTSLYTRIQMEMPKEIVISVRKEEFEPELPPQPNDIEQLEMLGQAEDKKDVKE